MKYVLRPAVIALWLLVAGCSASAAVAGDNSCDSLDDPDCPLLYDPSDEEEQLSAPPIELDHSATPSTPSSSADVMNGHRTSAGTGYNIWGNTASAGPKDGNCHNAANRENLGIVVCFGDPTLANPDPSDMAAYHTFNWAYQGNMAMFWNWSGDGNGGTNSSRVKEFPLPADYNRGLAPDMQSVRFAPAGKWGCGEGASGQWVPKGTRGIAAGLETRALPVETRVEESRGDVCKIHTGLFPPASMQTARDKCLGCCTKRTNKWPIEEGSPATYQSDFLNQCNAECNTL